MQFYKNKKFKHSLIQKYNNYFLKKFVGQINIKKRLV